MDALLPSEHRLDKMKMLWHLRANRISAPLICRPDTCRTAKCLVTLYSDMGRSCDIAVLGDTPAGYAAAYYLARQKLKVTLVSAPRAENECPLCDWTPRQGLRLAGLPETLAKASGSRTFKRTRYYNASLDKTVEYAFRRPAGFFVGYQSLCDAMRTATRDAGVQFTSTETAPAIELAEDHVSLRGTNRLVAGILLIVHSNPTQILADLALPIRPSPEPKLAAAALDIPLGDPARGEAANVLHIVTMPEQTELGLFFCLDRTLHLRVISSSSASGNRARELSEMVARLQQAHLVPDNIRLANARGAVWHPPAAAALELEGHVAKRCLLAGTAGGFADSITGQTIRPSIESAIVAAKAAHAAINSSDMQETLMKFNAAWRRKQADYLRPPSTPLRLLMPLLFANENLLAGFTNALVYGQSI